MIEHLREIKVLSEVADEEISRLAASSRPAQYKRHELIFAAGDPIKEVYLLISGRVRLYSLSEDGREVTLTMLDKGDFLGEAALTDALCWQVNAEAMVPTELCGLLRSCFEELLEREPTVGLAVAREAAAQMQKLQRQIEDLAFKPVVSRMAQLLLDQVQEQGSCFSLGLTHQEIASLIGTTRETASLTLSRLMRLGVLAYDRRTLRIQDIARLRAYARGQLVVRSGRPVMANSP